MITVANFEDLPTLTREDSGTYGRVGIGIIYLVYLWGGNSWNFRYHNPLRDTQ